MQKVKGNCWNNSIAESFFKTLNVELIYDDNLKTIEQTKTSIFEYIKIWYNKKRLHSYLGYKTLYGVELEFKNPNAYRANTMQCFWES